MCIGVIAGGEVGVITILMVILLGPAVDLVGRIMKTGRGVEFSSPSPQPKISHYEVGDVAQFL